MANLRIYIFPTIDIIEILKDTWGRNTNLQTALLLLRTDLTLNLIFYSPYGPFQPNISKQRVCRNVKLH